jgi:hypothetical protein
VANVVRQVGIRRSQHQGQDILAWMIQGMVVI